VIKTNLRLRIEENSFDQNHHPSAIHHSKGLSSSCTKIEIFNLQNIEK